MKKWYQPRPVIAEIAGFNTPHRLDKKALMRYNRQLSVMIEIMQKSKMHVGEIAFHLIIPAVMLSIVVAMGYSMVELMKAVFVI